jgi:hypothetical protein
VTFASSYPGHRCGIFDSTTMGELADEVLQTIGPLCAELVELKDLQSLLSLSWMTAILPTTCECHLHMATDQCGLTDRLLYSFRSHRTRDQTPKFIKTILIPTTADWSVVSRRQWIHVRSATDSQVTSEGRDSMTVLSMI